MPSARYFPPPWTAEETERTSRAAKLLTRDEARRIAANIAKLPGPAARARLSEA